MDAETVDTNTSVETDATDATGDVPESEVADSESDTDVSPPIAICDDMERIDLPGGSWWTVCLDDEVTWDEARAACARGGERLLTIDSEHEVTLFASELGGGSNNKRVELDGEDLWIGLALDASGAAVWIDGPGTDAYPSCGDDADGGCGHIEAGAREVCVALRDCGERLGFVCEPRCDDGQACTADARPAAGEACGASVLETCDDGDPCTADSACDPYDGCTHTADDVEIGGSVYTVCRATLGFDDAGAACASRNAHLASPPDGLAALAEVVSGEAWLGGDASEVELCAGELADDACLAITAEACLDGRACDTALPFVCLSDCDDGNPCTVDRHDPELGCVHEDNSTRCDDGDPCTIDVCDAQAGCGIDPTRSSCDDCVQATIGERDYLACRAERAWSDAMDRCGSMGGSLATAEDEAEAAAVSRLAAAWTGRLSWVGHSDQARDGEWVTVRGAPRTALPWCPGEPNDQDGNEGCAHANFPCGDGTYGWNDDECDLSYTYVCELGSTLEIIAKGDTWFTFGTSLPWSSARLTCLAFGADLPIVAGADDLPALEAIADEAGLSFYWLGHTDIADEGVVMSVDGASDFTSWCPSEPSDPNGGEDCMIGGWCEGGGWSDGLCSTDVPFFCRAVP